MKDNETFGLLMFAPIELHWSEEQQALDLCGTMMAGDQQVPFQVQMQGEAAIQSLRAFRRLLDCVDEETLATRRPRDQQ